MTLRTTKHPPYSKAVRDGVFLVSLCTCQNTSEPYSENLTLDPQQNVRAEGNQARHSFPRHHNQSAPAISSLAWVEGHVNMKM